MLAGGERRERRRRNDLNPAAAVLMPQLERPAVRCARFELNRITGKGFVDRGLQVAAGLDVNGSSSRCDGPDIHAAAWGVRETRRGGGLWSRRPWSSLAIRFRHVRDGHAEGCRRQAEDEAARVHRGTTGARVSMRTPPPTDHAPPAMYTWRRRAGPAARAASPGRDRSTTR